jgi:hypothetical protein
VTKLVLLAWMAGVGMVMAMILMAVLETAAVFVLTAMAVTRRATVACWRGGEEKISFTLVFPQEVSLPAPPPSFLWTFFRW